MQCSCQAVRVTFLLISTLFFALPSFAQEALFKTLPNMRSASVNEESWVYSKEKVLVDVDSIDLNNFSFQFPHSNMSGDSPVLRSFQTRGAVSRRSLSMKSSQSGLLLDDNGNVQGNYTVTRVGDAMHGLFIDNDGTHTTLRQNSDGSYSLRVEDHDNMQPCGDESHDHSQHDHAHDIDSGESVYDLVETSTDTNETIQLGVLVLLTPEVVEEAGSEDAAVALAEQAITLSNQSYENSGLNLSLYLVHTAVTSDSESDSFADDLGKLAINGDGVFDEAHTLRDEHYADMVALIRSPGQYCGIGYSASSVTALESGNYAFSLVASNCIDYYSFQHEIGHNLGLQHDVDNAPAKTAYEAPYGYRWTGENGFTYRSVMAYSPGTRVPYFSNPDVSYEGGATGVADQANNARVLGIVAAYAKDYRVDPNEPTPGGTEGGAGEEETTPGEGSGETGSGGGEEIESPSSEIVIEVSTKRKKGKRSKRSRKTVITFTVTDLDGLPVEGVVLNVMKVNTKKGTENIAKTLTTNANGVAKVTRKAKKGISYYAINTAESGETSEQVSSRRR